MTKRKNRKTLLTKNSFSKQKSKKPRTKIRGFLYTPRHIPHGRQLFSSPSPLSHPSSSSPPTLSFPAFFITLSFPPSPSPVSRRLRTSPPFRRPHACHFPTGRLSRRFCSLHQYRSPSPSPASRRLRTSSPFRRPHACHFPTGRLSRRFCSLHQYRSSSPSSASSRPSKVFALPFSFPINSATRLPAAANNVFHLPQHSITLFPVAAPPCLSSFFFAARPVPAIIPFFPLSSAAAFDRSSEKFLLTFKRLLLY